MTWASWDDGFSVPEGAIPRGGAAVVAASWALGPIAATSGNSIPELTFGGTTNPTGYASQFNWSFTVPKSGLYEFIVQAGGSGSDYQAADSGGPAGGLSYGRSHLIAGVVIPLSVGGSGASAVIGSYSKKAGGYSIATLPSGLIHATGGGSGDPNSPGVGVGTAPGVVNLRGGRHGYGGTPQTDPRPTPGEGSDPGRSSAPPSGTYWSEGGGCPGVLGIPKLIVGTTASQMAYAGTGAPAGLSSPGSYPGFGGSIIIRRFV